MFHDLLMYSYYDDNCQDYAGTEYPTPTEVSDPLTPGRGGPAGSHSIIWEYGELSENCSESTCPLLCLLLCTFSTFIEWRTQR
jgi:hypothetical protein